MLVCFHSNRDPVKGQNILAKTAAALISFVLKGAEYIMNNITEHAELLRKMKVLNISDENCNRASIFNVLLYIE